MKQNGTAINLNGTQKKNNKPMVWKEEANTGLDTVRKIILGKHVQEMESKLQHLSQNYQILLDQMEVRMSKKEAEHELRLLKLESEFKTSLKQLQKLVKNEINTIGQKVEQHQEKTLDFGKILMQLGKEWSIEETKE